MWQLVQVSLTGQWQCKQVWHSLWKKTWLKTQSDNIRDCSNKQNFIEKWTPWHIACTNGDFLNEWLWCKFLILSNNIRGVLDANIQPANTCYIGNQRVDVLFSISWSWTSPAEHDFTEYTKTLGTNVASLLWLHWSPALLYNFSI